MNQKVKEIKELLNLILTAVLIMCALIIISLLMINFGSRKENRVRQQSENKVKETNLIYHLSETVKVETSEDIKKLYQKVLNRPVRGFPLVIEFSSVVTVGG